MYQNISSHIKELELKTKYYNDNKNAWYYIVFVILVFAGSFTGLMLNYFRKWVLLLFLVLELSFVCREERTKELEVLYKDFVERDHLEKVYIYINSTKCSYSLKGNQFEDPAQNSCKDLLKSMNSLEDSVGEPIHRLYRSQSSSLHSNSYISLLCRRMSLGKSSMTLSERSMQSFSRDPLLLVCISGMTPSVRAGSHKILTRREKYDNAHILQP